MDKRKLTDNSNSNVLQNKKTKTDSVLEQDFINYISVPSLEDITIINLFTTLLKQPDVIDVIQQLIQYRYSWEEKLDSLHQIEEKISEKISFFFLPNLLKAKIANIIRPIVLQILKWADYNNLHFHNFIENMNFIQWTMEGTIDEAETLKLQLSNKNFKEYSISMDKFFKTACKYCLKNHITNLWAHIPQKLKADYYNKETHKRYESHLVSYWTSAVKNELPNLLNMIKPNDYRSIYNCNHSVYKNMFTLSVLEGNTLAVKYFWHKLTEEEINNNIVKWTEDVIQKRKDNREYSNFSYQKTNEHTNILCFLLSKMNDKEQQREVFQKYSNEILESLFSDWPWQKFLLPTIQVMWNFLDKNVYINILSKIVKEIKRGRTTEKLLKDLWCDSPINLKKCFIQYIISNHLYGTTVLWKLFEIEDVEAIKLILNAANVEEKKQIIFATTNKTNLEELIYAGKLNLLDKLIEETLSLEFDINNFKEKVVLKHGNTLCEKWIYKDNWQAVEKFFDWTLFSQDQIDNFKKNIIDKEAIVISLVSLGHYELVDKFMHWCFNSDEDVNQFKLYISQYDKMQSIIYNTIVYNNNFESAAKLLNWCLNSNEEIIQFKKKLILSKTGIDMFNRFVTNYKVYGSKYNNWELIKKLIQWYYPLEEEVIIAFKEEIKNKEEFIFGPEECAPFYSPKGKKQALFYLLDHFALDKNISDNETDSSDSDDHIAIIFGEIIDDNDDDSDDEYGLELDDDAVDILCNVMDVDIDEDDHYTNSSDCSQTLSEVLTQSESNLLGENHKNNN